MNLYIRYFDDEILVHNVEEGIAFLSSIEDVEVTAGIVAELEKFMNSSSMYPKHIKVHARSFFIAIKTTAETMEEFKSRGAGQGKEERTAQKEALAQYSSYQPGWYVVEMVFKRVIILPETQKSQYIDTTFVCKVKADSVQGCYDKVVGHLRDRKDIDARSQYPSIKSSNFKFDFLKE